MIEMPPLQFAQVNGIRMGYYEAGPKSDTPPVRPSDKPATPPPVAAPPPPVDPTPPPALQTTTDPDAFERKIQDTLTTATRDLNKVDPKVLGAEVLAQYQQAQRFVRGAYDALRNRNLISARELADKAAALARQLPKSGVRLSGPSVL